MILVGSWSHLLCSVCILTSCFCTGKITVDPVLVLRAVQRHGSDRWYAIGLEMGFSNSELTRITDSIPKHPDRLRAIFETKADEIGREHAAVSLLKVCKTIASPIYGIVADELSKSHCVTTV